MIDTRLYGLSRTYKHKKSTYFQYLVRIQRWISFYSEMYILLRYKENVYKKVLRTRNQVCSN